MTNTNISNELTFADFWELNISTFPFLRFVFFFFIKNKKTKNQSARYLDILKPFTMLFFFFY
jgi:hypothetical protein